MAPLKGTHCSLGFWSEVAVWINSNFCLHLLYQVTGRAPPERGSARGCTRLGRGFSRRDYLRGRSCTVQDRDNARTERNHVEAWIGFATCRQSPFFMSSAKVGAFPNVGQNSCYTTAIRIHLHRWPGSIVGKSCILPLYADETGVAGGYAFPGARPCVIAQPGSHHIVCPVPAKAKLSQGSRQVRAPLDKCGQSWHVESFMEWIRRCGVVTYDANYIADVTIFRSTTFPARNKGNFQAFVFQHLR